MAKKLDYVLWVFRLNGEVWASKWDYHSFEKSRQMGIEIFEQITMEEARYKFDHIEWEREWYSGNIGSWNGGYIYHLLSNKTFEDYLDLVSRVERFLQGGKRKLNKDGEENIKKYFMYKKDGEWQIKMYDNVGDFNNKKFRIAFVFDFDKNEKEIIENTEIESPLPEVQIVEYTKNFNKELVSKNIFIGFRNNGEIHGSIVPSPIRRDPKDDKGYILELIHTKPFGDIKIIFDSIEWVPFIKERHHSSGFLFAFLNITTPARINYLNELINDEIINHIVNTDIDGNKIVRNGKTMHRMFDMTEDFVSGNYKEAYIFDFDQERVEIFQD